jgi:hypothetical protein
MSPVGSSRSFHTSGSMGSDMNTRDHHGGASSMTTTSGMGGSRHSIHIHGSGATNSLQSNSSTSRGGNTSSPPKAAPVIPAHSHYVALAT